MSKPISHQKPRKAVKKSATKALIKRVEPAPVLIRTKAGPRSKSGTVSIQPIRVYGKAVKKSATKKGRIKQKAAAKRAPGRPLIAPMVRVYSDGNMKKSYLEEANHEVAGGATLFMEIQQQDDQGKAVPLYYPLCDGGLKVVMTLRSPDRSTWLLRLQWKDSDGHIHTAHVNRTDLVGRSATECLTRLVQGGLVLYPGVEDELIAFLQRHPGGEKAFYVEKSGWANNEAGEPAMFCLPGDVTFGGTEKAITPKATNSTFGTQGTLEEWQQNVGTLAVGNTRLVAIMSACFAGPLLRLLERDGLGIHLVAKTSIGKTSGIHAAASVFGKPGDAVGQWRTTSNALEGTAERANDCTLILDELHQLEPREAGKVAYALLNGKGKGRMQADTTLREVKQWRLAVLSSGELTLSDHAQSAGIRTTGGTNVRLLNVDAATGQHGMFERLHGKANGGAFADTLRVNAGRYYGTAFRAFLESLVKDRPSAIAFAREVQQKFEKDNATAGSTEIGRALSQFAVLAAAGELAAKFGVVPWPAGEATTAAKAVFGSWLKLRGTTGDADAEAGIKHIRLMIEKGEKQFQDVGSSEPPYDRLGWKKTDKDGKLSAYLIAPETFRTRFCEGRNMDVVLAELDNQDLLLKDKNSLQHQSRVEGQKARFYAIKAEIVAAPESSTEDETF